MKTKIVCGLTTGIVALSKTSVILAHLESPSSGWLGRQCGCTVGEWGSKTASSTLHTPQGRQGGVKHIWFVCITHDSFGAQMTAGSVMLG